MPAQNRSYWLYLFQGHFLEATAMEHTLQVKTTSGTGILRLQQQGRRFTVVDLTVNGESETFGFDPSKATAILDKGSDALQCFNIASSVRYGDVVLSNSEMRAVCVEDIAAALKVVKVRCFNPEEI